MGKVHHEILRATAFPRVPVFDAKIDNNLKFGLNRHGYVMMNLSFEAGNVSTVLELILINE